MSGSHSAAVFGAGREPIAAELARFGASRSFEDLPPVTLERARMIVASTLASAALGFDISSARIIRALALERGGTTGSIDLVRAEAATPGRADRTGECHGQ